MADGARAVCLLIAIVFEITVGPSSLLVLAAWHAVTVFLLVLFDLLMCMDCAIFVIVATENRKLRNIEWRRCEDKSMSSGR